MLRSLTTLLVILTIVPLTRGDDKDARSILNKAIAAHGSKKWADIKVHTWKAKGTMTANGMEMKYVADYFFQFPDKLRFDLAMNLDGRELKLSAASDGKTAWEQLGGAHREMEEKKREEFHNSTYAMNLCFLLPLKDRTYKLSSLGQSKVGGKPVIGLRVQRKGKPDVRLFFDKKTGLLAKSERRAFDEFSRKEVTEESLFTNYADKNGFKVFRKLTIKRAGKVFLVEELSAQKGLKKTNPKLFAKPKTDK